MRLGPGLDRTRNALAPHICDIIANTDRPALHGDYERLKLYKKNKTGSCHILPSAMLCPDGFPVSGLFRCLRPGKGLGDAHEIIDQPFVFHS